MASPITVRLDPETRRRVTRIARRKKLSTSEVVRQALEAWADREEPVTRPFELIKDLVGIVHGGDPHRSQDIGRKFTKALKERAAQKRRENR
ncbi:MAG TPA: ribbon-helix-helix protein, CopG family [Candidatus Dormibacteraeota bacterium]|nr:ribbon-helix-helix protein, CopG family [Candidatus Dormibacteraeota bacterium]